MTTCGESVEQPGAPLYPAKHRFHGAVSLNFWKVETMHRCLFLLLAITIAQVSHVEAEPTFAAGDDLFASYCTACHGPDARGTSASATLIGADLTKMSERRDGVWPMLEVMSIIDGYLTPNAERADMPVIEALNEGPSIDFDTGNGKRAKVPERLIAIVMYLESIQSPAPERYVP